MKKHLPRAADTPEQDPQGRQLVVIIVTDEVPQTWTTRIGANYKACTLAATTQTKPSTRPWRPT